MKKIILFISIMMSATGSVFSEGFLSFTLQEGKVPQKPNPPVLYSVSPQLEQYRAKIRDLNEVIENIKSLQKKKDIEIEGLKQGLASSKTEPETQEIKSKLGKSIAERDDMTFQIAENESQVKVLENTLRLSSSMAVATAEPVPEKTYPVWKLSPSVALSFYIEEVGTTRKEIGVVPGVGYGVRWNPEWWRAIGGDLFPYFLSLDLYLEAIASEENADVAGFDYFNIDILPAITLGDVFSFGFGVRFKRTLSTSLTDVTVPLMSVGLRRSM